MFFLLLLLGAFGLSVAFIRLSDWLVVRIDFYLITLLEVMLLLLICLFYLVGYLISGLRLLLLCWIEVFGIIGVILELTFLLLILVVIISRLICQSSFTSFLDRRGRFSFRVLLLFARLLLLLLLLLDILLGVLLLVYFLFYLILLGLTLK